MEGPSSLIGGNSSHDPTGEVIENTIRARWNDLCPPLQEMILHRLAIADSTGEVTEKTQRAPWNDLCPPLLGMVLDRLPIDDYLRFAAVCASWRDVQHDHRSQVRRHKCQMPWLISLEEEIFYNLLEQRYYRISLPKEVKGKHCIGASQGWLIFVNKVRPIEEKSIENVFLLLNPFTGSRINIPMGPQIVDTFYPVRENSVISVLSTVPTDPDLVALFARLYNKSYLYNARNEMWRMLYTKISEPVLCQGAFYWLEESYRKLVLVETDLTTLITRRIKLDLDQHMDSYFLVQSDGKLLVTGFLRYWGNKIKDFIVFDVDLSQGLLLRLETLGNRVLLYNNVNRASSLCLCTEETGGLGNRIYYVTESTYLWDEYPGPQWIEYDYASHEVINRTQLNLKQTTRYKSKYDDFVQWIVPNPR